MLNIPSMGLTGESFAFDLLLVLLAHERSTLWGSNMLTVATCRIAEQCPYPPLPRCLRCCHPGSRANGCHAAGCACASSNLCPADLQGAVRYAACAGRNVAFNWLQPPFTGLQAGLHVWAPHRICSLCPAGGTISPPGGMVKLVHQTQANTLQPSQLDCFHCPAGSKSRAASASLGLPAALSHTRPKASCGWGCCCDAGSLKNLLGTTPQPDAARTCAGVFPPPCRQQVSGRLSRPHAVCCLTGSPLPPCRRRDCVHL